MLLMHMASYIHHFFNDISFQYFFHHIAYISLFFHFMLILFIIFDAAC